MSTQLHQLEPDATIRRAWLQILQAKNEELARAELRIAELEAQVEELLALLPPASQEA